MLASTMAGFCTEDELYIQLLYSEGLHMLPASYQRQEMT
jgi:hypothetical protein